jgi:hypothetical protein
MQPVTENISNRARAYILVISFLFYFGFRIYRRRDFSVLDIGEVIKITITPPTWTPTASTNENKQ